jgi:signal recognition particle subunit SRP54
MLDTAGRTHIDEPLMAEMAEIAKATNPHETLLVADALTGQDAVNLAQLRRAHRLTGIVLTRMDGDGRGGAALSMRAVTGKPIKLIGTGEKMDALEEFHPERIADRILGMGDIVSLVEKAAETIDAEKAAAMAKKMQKASVRPERSCRPAAPDEEARRHGRHDGHDARHGQDEEADGRCRDRRQGLRPPDRHHPVDDAEGTRQARPSQAQPQEAHRRRFRHQRRRHQQAFEDAPPDGRHDEVHEGQEGRRHGGMPDLSKMSPKELEALQKQAEAAGLGGPGAPKLPGLGGPALPGLGSGPALPGLPKKK